MGGEDQSPGIAAHRLAVREDVELVIALRTVAADAILREANSPDIEELTDGEIANFVGLDMNDAGAVMRVQRRNESFVVVDADVGGDGYPFVMNEDVEVLVDVERVSLLR